MYTFRKADIIMDDYDLVKFKYWTTKPTSIGIFVVRVNQLEINAIFDRLYNDPDIMDIDYDFIYDEYHQEEEK